MWRLLWTVTDVGPKRREKTGAMDTRRALSLSVSRGSRYNRGFEISDDVHVFDRKLESSGGGGTGVDELAGRSHPSRDSRSDENNVRLMAIGNLDRLPADAYATLQNCIAQTSANTGVTLILALSYSARWEITEAVKRLAREAVEKKINPDDITEAVVSDYLTTKGIPDPDLLIRTGGEQRVSNFLLWQLSYAEFFFTDVYWPDFREEELYGAILYYQQRERRFGKTSEQLIL